MTENSKTTLIIGIVLLVLILIGLSAGGGSDSDEAIKEQVLDKYNSSGTIDCTGSKSQTPECKYLLGLPSDVGGNWQP